MSALLTEMEGDNPVDLSDEVAVRSGMTSVKSSVINIPSKIKEFWIEKSFSKRSCCSFMPSTSNGDRNRCVCGHSISAHSDEAVEYKTRNNDLWHAMRHTRIEPTDAFGQIDFQGGACYATKAQYARLDYMTSPEKILQLLLHHWKLELPKLLISVHGGIANFDLQPKLKRVFNKGLIKAANTTGAWIITGGTNTGVMRHVGAALAEKSVKKRKKHIVAIGIAPWGVVHRREALTEKDKAIDYHAAAHPKNNTAVLNSSHNYFLLADNGTEGKYGADIVLRKKLERYISHQRIHIRGEKPTKGCGVPIVCVVLEGGSNTIRTVLDYLTSEPPVPVVVCDGSGRAADLLAFVHKYTNEEGNLPSNLKEQLISTIKKTFSYNKDSADRLYYELIMCMKKKQLITIFRMGEQCQDIDLPILTALLTSHNTSAPQQLNLALSWDRVDVARSHIFTYGQDWPEGSLQQAMLDALVQNKVDFVELLLEKGVNMNKFLTIANLEELYNTKIGSTSTLHMMLREIRSSKTKLSHERVTLLEVGEVLEKLMGGAYRSRYCRKKFRSAYYAQLTKSKYNNVNNAALAPDECSFSFPFSDLMIWAVLLKRQKMAQFMWRREEQALVKAIVACKLYKALAREAIDEPLVDNEVSEELYLYAKEFQKLAVDILDHCYKEDDDLANQLLTYELKSFSNQTCISLAHSAYMRDFIAHPCCQNLITDMWMGGLRMNKSSTYKVILGILLPFSIIALDFKSKEELQLLPQTVEEHIDELQDCEEASTDSDDDQDIVGMDAESMIENYPELDHVHADEVNKIVTWQSVDDSERNSNEMDSSYKPADNSFFNTNTLLKLKELRKRQQELKLGKKVSEFYKAPVTKFWLHTMAYLIFICLYNYLLLVRLSRHSPSWMEVYVIVYIFFHGVEMMREIAVSEPTKLSHKIKMFFSEKWNLMDAFSIPMFWVGVAFRFQLDENLFLIGRVIYCVNIIFWYVRILELFAVSKHLGPYVVIIGKLVMDMLNFIVILLIVLMSFGVARQALRNPYQEPSWYTIRDVFLEPYFMLYGEVYAGDIDPPCGPGTAVPTCWPGRWITPAIMSAYLLVANILLLNLLIAVFNNTYQKTSQNSREIWMFQRYSLTLEYEIKPLLPAPLILFSFIYLACKWIRRRCKHQPKIQDYGLKLFLGDDEVRKLHDFEEDCVDDYFNTLEMKFESSTEERIKATNQRVENIMLKMDDINQKENQVKMSMQAMELRIANLEDLAVQNYEQAQRLNNQAAMAQATSGGLTSGHSTSSVDQFPMELTLTDVGPTPSQPISRPPLTRCRSRSGDTAEIARKRLHRQNVIPMVADGSGRPNLLRRRRGKDLKPIKTSNIAPGYRFVDGSKTQITPPEVAAAVRASLHMEEAEMPHSYSATSGLPAIKETLLNTPTDENMPVTYRGKRAVGDQAAASSAPGELEQDTRHPKLCNVHSLPVPVANRNHVGELESSSVESTSPRARGSLQSLRSLASPLFYSLQSAHGDSYSALSPDQLGLTFTPVKSSLRNEYTSITDTIDTSCIHNSPESSPGASFSSPNRFFFGPSMDQSDVNRFFPGAGGLTEPVRELLQQETRVHLNAEEHENEVLGSSIRKRIRQLSIDDSNSMSDLAQLIIGDLGSGSPGAAVDELEGTSTNFDLTSTLPATLLNNNINADIDLSQSNHF